MGAGVQGLAGGLSLFFSAPFFPQAIPELSPGFGDERAVVRWARQACEQPARKAARNGSSRRRVSLGSAEGTEEGPPGEGGVCEVRPPQPSVTACDAAVSPF